MNDYRFAVLVAAIATASCASNSFETSWRAPEATPLQIQGSKVAAIAMMEGEAERRAAEDALVRELGDRGADGVAMYTIMPGASLENEAEVRAALDGMGFAGAVVMRPFERTTEIVSSVPLFASPSYQGLWGGYYGYGWRDPWRVGVIRDVRTRTVVSVEVLVYSLRQNRLVWGGQTRATGVSGVDRLVDTTARRVAKELQRQGLLTVAGAA
jgi:hypothetical protein